MAENGHQDVVNQVQSADASAPVDVSASTIDPSAAVAASSSVSTFSNTETAGSEPVKTATSDTSIDENKTSRAGQYPTSDDTTTEISNQTATNGTSGDVSAPPSVGQSAESDTDLSKNDASETTSKGGDVPKYSVKKPSAFKSVSVAKNFLAKAGTPPAQLAKTVSDAPAVSASLSSTLAANSARPRLVAKTASGQKLSLSTQSNGVKSGRPMAPDPMQVWNRNRVQAPQATPKHLTDEELRQQYGIQLASIPVLDGDDKGNKWADIDDDEDDWAPEVIEWSDGSKINLAEAEKAAAEKTKAAEEAKRGDEAARMQQATTKATLSLGPRATVLKVGGGSAQNKSGTEASSSLKLADKPTLVAKPVVPAPVKSPWAALPPIEKVPPVAPNLEQPMTVMSQRPNIAENNLSERGPAGWRSAKAIAADDFSRMPRDAINGTPRELFNSQSGKYEPVHDGRRGSMKKDQGFRQPAVLQRPGPEHEMGSSADRELHDQQSELSNVRRPSVTHALPDSQHLHEQTQPWRRPSNQWLEQPRGGPQSPALASPDVPASADLTTGSPDPQSQALPNAPVEDPVAMQKRLMRETREAAIKRRQEAEAAEEAAKRERIRKKLESLPPPPEKKEKEKLDTPSPSKSITELMQRPGEENKPVTAKVGDDSRSPPKPPAPGPAMQQYGMIKVHPSPVPNGVSPVAGTTTAAPPSDITMERQMSGHEASYAKHMHETSMLGDHRAPARTGLDLGRREKAPEEDSRWNMSQKAWERVGDVAGLPNASNPWAPSGSQRNLGNGDFLPAPRSGPFRQAQISPEQILPSPQQLAPPALFGEPKSSGPLQPQQTGGFGRQYHEAVTAFATKPASDVHPQPPSTQSRTPALPSPLAHGLSSQHGLTPTNQVPPLPDSKLGVSAWNSFSHNAPEHDAIARARINQDAMMRIVDTESRGQQPMNRMITERWKQTMSGDEAGSRRVVGVQTTTRNQAPGPPATQSIGIVSEEPRQPPVSMPPQHPRSSKFQNMFKELHQELPITSKSAPLPQRAASPPLPPPETTQHPAFDKVSIKPTVNLPGMNRLVGDRPVPIVRLPPPKAMPEPSILDAGRMNGITLRGPPQPLAKNRDWQNRFNGLFKQSAPREGTDFSISKAAFDILSVSEAAAVSFPQAGQISPTSPRFDISDAKAKSIEEEAALFEADLHPGSTPPVSVPTNKFAREFRPASVSAHAQKKTSQLQLHDNDIASCRTWIIGREDFRKDKLEITARILGMPAPQRKQLDLATSHVHDPRAARPIGAHQARAQAKSSRKTRESTVSSKAPQSPRTWQGQLGSEDATVPATFAHQTWASRVAQAAT